MTPEHFMQAAIAIIVKERAASGAPGDFSDFNNSMTNCFNKRITFLLGNGSNDDDDSNNNSNETREINVAIEYIGQNKRFRLSVIDRTAAAASDPSSAVFELNSSSINASDEMSVSYTSDDGKIVNYNAALIEGAIYLFQQGDVECIRLKRTKHRDEDQSVGAEKQNVVISPVAGLLNRILVKPGDLVKKGQPLVVLIAMMMEFVVRATRDGKVQSIPFAANVMVQKGCELVIFEDDDESSAFQNNA